MKGRNLFRLAALCLAVALLLGGLVWVDSTTGLAAARVLRQGDRGDDVRTLQTNLNDAGFATGGVTGYFGSGTLSAVKSLQKKAGLTADGLVGPATLAALDASLSKAKPATSTKTGSTSTTTYTVKAGDALSIIAERYGVAMSKLLAANNLKSADRIYVGQRLTIPGGSSADGSGGSGAAPAGDTTEAPAPPQPDTTADGEAKPVLYTADRRLALTFDDGPDAVQTPKILEILAKHKAVATFFVVGERAETNPDVVKQAAAAGNAIENHGYQHTDLTRASGTAVRTSITKGAAVIEQLTGAEPGYFRPPAGAFSADVTAAATDAGERMVMWSNIGSTTLPAAQLQERLLGAAFDGAVLLLHDTDPAVVEVLDATLTQLEKEGYTFVTIPELFR